MTPEQLAEIGKRWHEYDGDGIEDYRVLEDLHSLIDYVRELEQMLGKCPECGSLNTVRNICHDCYHVDGIEQPTPKLPQSLKVWII